MGNQDQKLKLNLKNSVLVKPSQLTGGTLAVIKEWGTVKHVVGKLVIKTSSDQLQLVGEDDCWENLKLLGDHCLVRPLEPGESIEIQ